MKKKFILSLFEKYSFPQGFLDMPLEQIVFLHSQALGRPIDKPSYERILNRSDFLYRHGSGKSIQALIDDAKISVKLLDSGINLGGYVEFSYLLFEDRVICLNNDSINKMEELCVEVFGKSICKDIAFTDIFLAHEYCHFVDYCDNFLFDNMVQREISAYLYSYNLTNLICYPWILELLFFSTCF